MKIPYFRKQFSWNLFFFEFGLMYCDETIQGRKLFKGGNYSRTETIRGNTVAHQNIETIIQQLLFEQCDCSCGVLRRRVNRKQIFGRQIIFRFDSTKCFKNLDFDTVNSATLPTQKVERGSRESRGRKHATAKKSKIEGKSCFFNAAFIFGQPHKHIIFVVLLSGLVILSCFGGIQSNLNCIPYARHYNPRLVYFLPHF